jgi:carboxyl-terminal processing protease
LREYRIAETQTKNKLTAEEINRYPITDDLVAAFRQHIAAKPQFNLSDELVTTNLAYIRSQMRRELITAAYGAEAGEQAYLPDDAQFHKAIESLDQVRMLADNASRARGDRQ